VNKTQATSQLYNCRQGYRVQSERGAYKTAASLNVKQHSLLLTTEKDRRLLL